MVIFFGGEGGLLALIYSLQLLGNLQTKTEELASSSETTCINTLNSNNHIFSYQIRLSIDFKGIIHSNLSLKLLIALTYIGLFI